jgi:antitoxin component of MazEF toxin-antitoxin module
MADTERVRVEISFRNGQSLTVNVAPAVVDELEAALAKGSPEAVTFEAEDGRYTAVTRMVAFVKRHLRESRVGFGS